MAQTEAKNALIEKLIDLHEFPVPESYVDQQLQNNLENQLRSLAAQGADVKKLASGIDWAKYKENQGDRARRDVRGSLVLGKDCGTGVDHPTQDEVDAEVQRLARQQREPVAAVRMKLEKDGSLDRIANRIRTEKVLNFLFEHAVKVAPAPEPASDRGGGPERKRNSVVAPDPEWMNNGVSGEAGGGAAVEFGPAPAEDLCEAVRQATKRYAVLFVIRVRMWWEADFLAQRLSPGLYLRRVHRRLQLDSRGRPSGEAVRSSRTSSPSRWRSGSISINT
jgi:hypothetical protein